jgi:hypothetical protein
MHNHDRYEQLSEAVPDKFRINRKISQTFLNARNTVSLGTGVAPLTVKSQNFMAWVSLAKQHPPPCYCTLVQGVAHLSDRKTRLLLCSRLNVTHPLTLAAHIAPLKKPAGVFSNESGTDTRKRCDNPRQLKNHSKSRWLLPQFFC